MVRHAEKYHAEKAYRAFYDDVMANFRDWKLFYSIENNQHIWAERSCGILGNLATIYRQRGNYTGCDEVMRPYRHVIDQYGVMIAIRKARRLSDDNELVCLRGLTMRYHRIYANLALNLRRAEGMPESIRVLMQFEFDTGVTDDDSEYAWMLPTLLRKPYTAQALATTTEAELLRVTALMITNAPPNGSEPIAAKVQLALCANCRSTEPFLDTYKVCSRCRSVKYCGKVIVCV